MINKTINKSKEELILEIKKRVEDKIIEKTNADLIIKLINNSDSLSEAIAIAQLGTTYKRTGFHFDKRLEKMDNTIKYFKKNEELSFVNDEVKLTHKLIIGDNYDALLNLLIEYKNKIDVIYIDPPYGKDSMGEFADTNYNNAITRDNLLSMLYPRLFLAKQLLSDNGVIFCSIDDRNQAQVKSLFDEIFEEKNFVGNITRITTKRVKGDAKEINKINDYILVYDRGDFDINHRIKENLSIYKEIDSHVAERGKYLLRPLDNGSINYSSNCDYIIKAPDESEIVAGGDINRRLDRLSGHHSKKDWCYRWSEEKFKWGIENDYIVFKQDESTKKWRVYFKIYEYVDNSLNPTTKLDNYLSVIDECYNNQGTTEIKSIFGRAVFDYPKPISLISLLLQMHQNQSAVVLDFFAGSGTTGHAVMQLNKEDGGKRKFILCTNNEATDINSNGIAYDVTSKRLKRIMSGECYDGTKDFDWIRNNEPYGDNLDVYEINKVANSESSENKTPFDVIDETLYGLDKFVSIKDKVEWVCNNFEHTQKNVETDDKWRERLEIE